MTTSLWAVASGNIELLQGENGTSCLRLKGWTGGGGLPTGTAERPSRTGAAHRKLHESLAPYLGMPRESCGAGWYRGGSAMDDQIDLLRGIWNEVKAVNGRIDTTNTVLRTDLRAEIGALRVDLKDEMADLRTDLRGEMMALRIELKQENDLVHRRSVERDLRLAASLTELSHDIRELTGVVHVWRDEHRLDRADLRDRVDRLERRLGLDPR
jgi:hypothetical protein